MLLNTIVFPSKKLKIFSKKQTCTKNYFKETHKLPLNENNSIEKIIINFNFFVAIKRGKKL